MSDCKEIFHQEVGVTCQHFGENINLKREIKELEEREKRLVEYFQKAVVSARFFCKHADCPWDSWNCRCDFCKNNHASIDLNNCEKFLKELGIKDKE